MKLLLLGKGKSIESIKKYLKSKKVDFVQAVFEYEHTSKKHLLIDDSLLELEGIDYAIKSPGIPETNKMYLKLSQKYKFISELDLLYIFKEKIKTIVVTGSNGKTTFVSMLEYLLKKANIKCQKCGNSFEPITYYYKKFNKLEYLVIEQSSFQLHDLKFFNPYISVILNLQENHLDNSYSLNSYFENKKNIYKYQNKENYFIYDSNNEKLRKVNTNANIIDLLDYPNLDKIKKDLQKYRLDFNYIYTIFKLLSIDEKVIEKINDFKTLQYRESLKNIGDVTFINDSKSTSIDSTLFAISHIDKLKNTILIIGGKDKNSSLHRLSDLGVKYIICYGEITMKSIKQIKNVITCKTLVDAFKIATCISYNDKVILFSPATSSFDQYKSYIERGKHFDKLVKEYEKNHKDR